jgi:hypothetical protein
LHHTPESLDDRNMSVLFHSQLRLFLGASARGLPGIPAIL